MANLVVGHVTPLSWAGFREDIFGRLEAEMDRFLSDMVNPKAIQRMKGDHYPKTDVYKEGHNLVFKMAVPFCKKEDLKISLDNGILAVSGGAYDGIDPFDDKRDFLIKEIRRSSFTRSWQLPGDRPDLAVGEDDIIAELEDGILTVSVVDFFVEEEKKPTKKEIKIK